MKTVSVIVPVYNVEKYLNQCVDSWLAQDYSPLEIILVDDQSTDSSGSICDKYASDYPNVKVLHVQNGGPNRACYEGLMISTGQYIVFCDSDDWVDADMISRMAELVDTESENKKIVCCNYIIERESGKKKYCRHGAKPGVYLGEDLEQKIKKHIIGQENRVVSMSRCMKLFSRELLTENVDLWDFKLRMGDDMTIVIPAICDADEIVIMEDAFFYHYRFLNSSLVHKYDDGLYQNIQLLRDRIYAVLNAKRDHRIYEIDVEREYTYLLMLVLKNEIRGNRNYLKNIMQICEKEKTPVRIQRYGLEVTGIANKLCKSVLNKPCRDTIERLYLAMKLYSYIQ